MKFSAYPSDNSRFDVVVKDEQRWYLKTSNKAERQTWLIALGSSKATTANENCSAEPGSKISHKRIISFFN